MYHSGEPGIMDVPKEVNLDLCGTYRPIKAAWGRVAVENFIACYWYTGKCCVGGFYTHLLDDSEYRSGSTGMAYSNEFRTSVLLIGKDKSLVALPFFSLPGTPHCKKASITSLIPHLKHWSALTNSDLANVVFSTSFQADDVITDNRDGLNPTANVGPVMTRIRTHIFLHLRPGLCTVESRLG